MTKGLEKIRFFCFCILIKRKYENSVILGSVNQIAKKVGVSEYHARKLINYGINKGLISKSNNIYNIASYKQLLNFLDLPFDVKHLFIMRFGNFDQLVERNLYLIARNNFKQQTYNIEKATKLLLIKKKIETDYTITKVEYKFYQKYYNAGVLGSTKLIVTGQKKISQLLGISQSYANNLLEKWNKLGFILREISFSKSFDRFEDGDRLLRLSIGNFICDGSIIHKFI